MWPRFVGGTGKAGWWMFDDFWRTSPCDMILPSLHTFEDWFRSRISKLFVCPCILNGSCNLYIITHICIYIYSKLLSLSSPSCGLALKCVCLGRQHGTSWGAFHHWHDSTWDGCWMMLAWSRSIRSNTMYDDNMICYAFFASGPDIPDHSYVGKLYWRGLEQLPKPLWLTQADLKTRSRAHL